MKNLLLRACTIALALIAAPTVAQVVRVPVVTNSAGSPTPASATVLVGSNGTEKGTSGNPVVTSCPTCSGSSGPAATQLPATLGPKTGALSLSVVPNTDTAFPVTGTFWQATQPVSGTVAATQSGAWNVTNISGTVSLPTGAATAAGLTTINTTLGSPFQAGGSIGNTTFAATQATASSLNAQVVGTVASGATDSGNPIKIGGVFNTTLPTLTTGQRGDAQMDTRGGLFTVLKANGSGSVVNVSSLSADANAVSTALWVNTQGLVYNGTNWDRLAGNTSGQYVQGPGAHGATVAGNPNLIAGYASNTVPTAVTAGQAARLWVGLDGQLVTSLGARNTVSTATSTSAIYGYDASGNSAPFFAASMVSDGTNVTPARGITGSDGTGAGIQAAAIAPQSSANGAIAGVVSTTAEGSHILKASAGNLYRVVITTAGTAGYLMVFNATSAPADGAVTPAMCRVIAANSTLEVIASGMPVRFGTGITAVFSSTGCFTKTISATAYIEGYAQ